MSFYRPANPDTAQGVQDREPAIFEAVSADSGQSDGHAFLVTRLPTSQTGCVNAPLQATSQASRRTQFRPVSLTSELQELFSPNGPVSDRSIRSR